jgi:hypothetical protein
MEKRVKRAAAVGKERTTRPAFAARTTTPPTAPLGRREDIAATATVNIAANREYEVMGGNTPSISERAFWIRAESDGKVNGSISTYLRVSPKTIKKSFTNWLMWIAMVSMRLKIMLMSGGHHPYARGGFSVRDRGRSPNKDGHAGTSKKGLCQSSSTDREISELTPAGQRNSQNPLRKAGAAQIARAMIQTEDSRTILKAAANVRGPTSSTIRPSRLLGAAMLITLVAGAVGLPEFDCNRITYKVAAVDPPGPSPCPNTKPSLKVEQAVGGEVVQLKRGQAISIFHYQVRETGVLQFCGVGNFERAAMLTVDVTVRARAITARNRCGIWTDQTAREMGATVRDDMVKEAAAEQDLAVRMAHAAVTARKHLYSDATRVEHEPRAPQAYVLTDTDEIIDTRI